MSRVRSKSTTSGLIESTRSHTSIVDYDGDPDSTWGSMVQLEAADIVPHYPSYETAYTEETMVDQVTPNFKKRSAAGEVFMSPMQQSKISKQDGTCSWRINLEQDLHDEVTRRYSFYGTTGVKTICQFDPSKFPPPASFDLETLKGQAVAQAHSNISLSKMQLLATMGEGKKTVSSVVSILHRVYRIIRAVKNLDLKYLKGQISFEQLADRYMEARYALRPLFYDVANLSNALQATPPAKSRQTFRGKVSDSDLTSLETVVPIFDDGFHIDLATIQSRSTEVVVTAGVLTDVVFMGSTHTFGLTEVAESAWELVPFSFVVDWFTNLGKLISAWAPNPGFSVVGSWVKTEISTVYDCYPTEIVNIGTPWSPSSSGTFSGSYMEIHKTITREPSPSIPWLPSFDVNLDMLKLLDIVMLLRNL